eukprot:CAMPEP_0201705202 /NCGR_PEP_ID=MMETSP0578-20130828/45060_1 /ASSEMBLY_ACC=CAM_ASM_000663 /TAXON_ID=267565 /ORGANISM="Skeletonema grethea, Strain CCMP 1804" /LENGTH=76 /DNA_ID=CAMNT_0048193389 /DNA_START=48 /DNA_END=275 /DNA_ORIENTATION=+
MTSSFPSSGTWCKNARKPLFPAKGKPANPPKLNPSCQRLTIKATSCSSLLLTSSEQTECAKIVFFGVNPLPPKVLA